MLKNFALLTMLATPALAHQTTFDQPDFLKMSGCDLVQQSFVVLQRWMI